MEERHAISGKKMSSKRCVSEYASRHLNAAGEDLDSSKSNPNRAQEDALPPTRRKELWHGTISSVKRNVGVARLGVP